MNGLLKGKRTYITIAFAVLYLVASGLGWIEYNAQVKNTFELIALGFLRSALGNEEKPTTIITK